VGQDSLPNPDSRSPHDHVARFFHTPDGVTLFRTVWVKARVELIEFPYA